MGEKEDMVEREIKLCDKIKALDILCHYLGLYQDKSKVGGNFDDGFVPNTGVVLLPEIKPLEDPPESNDST